MSYMNWHMDSLVPVRVSVNTNNSWIDILNGTTWENFKARHVSDQEYGWTRFNDLTIVAYYFKHRFTLSAAAEDIGYSASTKAYNAIVPRLKRVNIISFLDIGRALIHHNLITVEDLRLILTDPVYPPPGKVGRKPWQGVMYKYLAKRIVQEAINKWGSQEKAAEKLNVKLTVVQYWDALDVKDPMVKAMQRN